ncbi:hypothetical protein E0E52_13000 [Azotobacter chroococcum]|uniref:hypothetical protein n=1 Tax=Azotobacter chroococcum TaxID=353 RepID=UPI00103F5060|nr:hypothetical protein [Azotobacter chroococcum]TBW04259.1 hypothetical protein E0E52_13000 [Azotobacter chroococcum]
MTFAADNQPAKRRGRARSVTRSEADDALQRLRSLAEAGNVDANVALIGLADRPRQENAAA